MTKETKVGLVIGLFFIVGVVYLLHWATKPSEFEQPSFPRQDISYQTPSETVLEPPHTLSVSNRAPLPADNSIASANETALLGGATVAPDPVLEASKPPQRFYVVKPGQTLSDIAREVYGPQHVHEWRLIHEANKYKIPNPHVVQADLKLLIPSLPGGVPVSTPSRLPVRSPSTYTVKPGDTLSDIASAKLGSSRRWEEILSLNSDKLPDEYSLQPGMVLKIPVTSGAQLRLPGTPDDIHLSIR